TPVPFNLLTTSAWIKARSMSFPISLPRASSSRTRCPLHVPPILGLQCMRAMPSTLTVNTMVLIPSLAHARAASQPACPAPMTATSYTSLFSHTEFAEYFIDQILSYRFSCNISQRLICIHQIDGIKVFRHPCLHTVFYPLQALIRFSKRLLLPYIRNINLIIKGYFSLEKHIF